MSIGANHAILRLLAPEGLFKKIFMSIINKFVDYLRSSKSELEKVSWPSRQETIRYSSLVLGVSVLVAVFFAGLDFGLGKLVDAALQRGVAQRTDAFPTPAETPSPTPATVPGFDIQGGEATVVPINDSAAQPQQ